MCLKISTKNISGIVNKYEISNAIHWWLSENCGDKDEISRQIKPLLSFFYSYVNTLFTVLKTQPLPKAKSSKLGIESNAKYAIYINSFLSPYDFFSLRGILALVGDLYFLLKEIRKLTKELDNQNLFELLDKYLPNLKEFRYTRNYFAHFDERIGKGRGIHGVTGKLDLPEIGIRFREDALNCFYLILTGDKIYYHDKQRFEQKPTQKSISLNKESLQDIFTLARNLYDLMISHSIHPTDYKSSKLLFSFE